MKQKQTHFIQIARITDTLDPFVYSLNTRQTKQKQHYLKRQILLRRPSDCN